MNKFTRLVSALVAIFGRKTTVTAAPVKRVYAPNKDGGYSILRLAAENRRLKHTVLGLEDVLESVNDWGNKVADNAIAYAGENALLKERIAVFEDVIETITESEDQLAGAARELERENAKLTDRIARLEDENRWLAIWMEENRLLATEAMRLLDAATINIGYKDIRPSAVDGDVFIRETIGDDIDGDIDGDTDGDDYSEWDNAPLYGFKSVKTARHHCRACRRVEKHRGHRCGKK
jgi:hypothetical protein